MAENDRVNAASKARDDLIVRPADLGELTVIMDWSFGHAVYVGTRMQIEAEGIVPIGCKWPDGYGSIQWEVDGICFRLTRTRPEGTKGSRRDFIDCDNWRLSMRKSNWNATTHHIAVKAKELRDMLYRDSQAGRAASQEIWAATVAAMEDQKFQAFKALVPGLVPEPRARRGGRSAQARKIEQ
ncbi:hypothetical protein [Burkholderia cepacia]|uniref:hypothetical protein n=1 Tax=Burkholderia cepacia TaxID=292 RepID=UPI00158881DC|nr:hypothetical protein [Burkholderia cepacia]